MLVRKKSPMRLHTLPIRKRPDALFELSAEPLFINLNAFTALSINHLKEPSHYALRVHHVLFFIKIEKVIKPIFKCKIVPYLLPQTVEDGFYRAGCHMGLTPHILQESGVIGWGVCA